MNDQEHSQQRPERFQWDDFAVWFDSEIKPSLAQPADMHKRARLRFYLIAAAGLAGLIAVLSLTEIFISLQEIWDWLPYLVILIYLFLVVFWPWTALAAIQDKARSIVISKICEQVGLDYSPYSINFGLDLFRSSQLVPFFEQERSYLDGYFFGQEQDLEFSFAEARLNEERGIQGSGTSSVKAFRGLLCTVRGMDQRQYPSGHVMVRSRQGLLKNRLPRKSNLISWESGEPSFDSNYQVFTEDSEQARNWLTPERITYIQSLSGQLARLRDWGGLYFSLYHQHLLLALPLPQRVFHFNLFRAVDDPDQVRRMLRGISLAYDLKDTLALNLVDSARSNIPS